MTTLDLTPLYRSSIGFDRFGSLLNNALQEKNSAGYPPYDIEAIDENQYAITLAVAGFKLSELNIQTENGVLTISGNKENDTNANKFLHKGIAQRSFERKFNLADHVEVVNADLSDGLLNIELVKEIPEAMKPKSISINSAESKQVIEQKSTSKNKAAA